MTKEIPLTQGQVALVDDDRFEELNQYGWFAHYYRNTKSFYAQRHLPTLLGKRKIILMHRVIMNAPEGMLVDHKDRNTLNNQVHNLRICTNSQNASNSGKQSDNTSGYKGVTKPKWGGWRAAIKVNGKTIYLKKWKTKEEAARAYDEAAKKYHGEFASLNFPDG